ncbi:MULTISPECIES: sterol desaturase family protein [Kordiimonas]|jgi:sterol desaturase/sphingolipid hydroxylase (fatty acid hydroxylase superfamily)|uniref:sterol desaturase family protein n=1 Tax=Kordiimonas TaxID=288021 RepID=UPI00257BCED2|nr:sterol desaturase family protein [Kordiimonas sp. UBA4487]
MPLDLPSPTDFAVPAFVFFVLVEMIYGWKTGRTKFEGKDAFTSLIMGLGSTVSGAITVSITFFVSYWVWENFALFHWGHAAWVFVVAFVLDDLAYYWIHRFGHRSRWMWAAHVIHHSSQHYNLTTALRQTWTSQLTPGALFRWPIFILGIEPGIVFFCAGLNLIYQFWIHTEAIDRMPRWFEAVMNTPSHHRVHHANNPKYLDANYAGVFIIWDKLFGSFVPEDRDEPCRYGLVRDLGTFNPLRVAFHEWWGIVTDMWQAKGLRTKLMFLVAPPGWTPDGSRKTSDMIKAEWRERQASTNSGSIDSPPKGAPQAAE